MNFRVMFVHSYTYPMHTKVNTSEVFTYHNLKILQKF